MTKEYMVITTGRDKQSKEYHILAAVTRSEKYSAVKPDEFMKRDGIRPLGSFVKFDMMESKV